MAQDEWFFKDMLRGKTTKLAPPPETVHFKVRSPLYHLDISGDQTKEYINFLNEDGKQIVKIYNSNRENILTQKLQIKGHDARVYKITTKQISVNRKLTILHFFEGKTDYLEKKGSSVIYGLVVEDGKLTNLEMKKLTGVWIESQIRENYYRRPYEIYFEDLDKDGTYELIVHSGKVHQVIFYKGKNEWHTL